MNDTAAVVLDPLDLLPIYWERSASILLTIVTVRQVSILFRKNPRVKNCFIRLCAQKSNSDLSPGNLKSKSHSRVDLISGVKILHNYVFTQIINTIKIYTNNLKMVTLFQCPTSVFVSGSLLQPIQITLNLI